MDIFFVMVLELMILLQSVTRLASALWLKMLFTVFKKLNKVNVKWLMMLGALGTFLPGCEATEGYRSVCGGGPGSFPLLMMIAYMMLPVLPYVCLPVGDADSADAPRTRYEWAGKNTWYSSLKE
jgi:hypothetical protein